MNIFFQNIKIQDYPDQLHTSKNNNKTNTNIQLLQAWNKIYMKSVLSISKYPIPITALKISTVVPDKQALEPMPNSNQHSNNFANKNLEKHLNDKISSNVATYATKNISTTNPRNEIASSKMTLARASIQVPIKNRRSKLKSNSRKNETNEKDVDFSNEMCEKDFETNQYLL